MGNVLKHVFSGEQAFSLFPTTSLGIRSPGDQRLPCSFLQIHSELPSGALRVPCPSAREMACCFMPICSRDGVLFHAHLLARWNVAPCPSARKMGVASRKTTIGSPRRLTKRLCRGFPYSAQKNPYTTGQKKREKP